MFEGELIVDPKLFGAIIGVVVAGIFAGLVKLIPVVIKAVRSNSDSGKNPNLKSIECKPGKAQICIDRGTTLTQHSETIKHLIEITGDAKQERRDIKKEIKDGFQRVYDKLDRI